MDRIGTLAAEVFAQFLSLPILTQWSVAILLSAGIVVHVFAYNERTAHDGPSIFTTAGIFFTFVGIAEGLFGFNSLDIESSVPTLLGGLKTAFIASVFGVGIALTLKLRLVFFGLPQSGGSETVHGATIDDLAHQLIAVRNALIGQDDSTLVSQLKLTRSDTNERLDNIKKSQAEFMEKMADNNSKALIQALQEVIRDFNTKISEQFGENFKRLNDAVGQLLVWQERYRLQLSEMIEQQTATAKNMDTATARYGELVAKAETFSTISNQLATLLTALNGQRAQIESSLKSLAELFIIASSSLPQIESKIIELTNQMTKGVISNQVEITKTLKDSSIAFQGTVGDIKKLLLEATQSTNQEVNAHFKQLGEKTSEQIAKLDIALEKELTKAITTLASQLTSLSAQFVSDYGPLTANLRDIVQSARK